MKHAYLALIAIAALAVAGCPQGGGPVITTGTYGLEIVNYSADVSEIFTGSKTRISMAIENLGETIVGQTRGGILLIGAGDWSPANAVVAFKKDMRPADPVRGVPADKQTQFWTITAPSLPRGQTRPYTLTGRVYYDYNTSSRGSIFIYPISEATAERERGGTLEGSAFTTTRGPVQMSVSVAPDPVIIEKAGESFTLQITFNNIGGGVPYSYGQISSPSSVASFSLLEDNLNNLVLTITGINTTKPTAGDVDQTIGLQLTDPTCLDAVKLVAGSTSVICDVNVTLPAPVKTSYSIGANIGYGYYTDRQLTISALGK